MQQKHKKLTFAIYVGNRGFMPAELLHDGREEMKQAIENAGYNYLIMDEDATRYGAVETRDEGLVYKAWLKSHEGEYDGVICCQPIFIDEIGAATALQDAGVPILMQAYPDEIGKMDFAYRRDAFCGKFSVTDVFTQYGIPFTVMKPHAVRMKIHISCGLISEFFARKPFFPQCRRCMEKFKSGKRCFASDHKLISEISQPHCPAQLFIRNSVIQKILRE
jgi:L-fucose isomerase-like protein